MQDISKFSELVGSFYESVADPAHWKVSLGAICDHFEGNMTTLAVHEPAKNLTRFGAYYGDAKMTEPLVSSHAANMPLYCVIPRMEIDEAIGLDTLYDYFGPNGREAFYASDFGQNWAVPNRVGDGLCLALLKHESRIGTLVVTTDIDRRPVSKSDLDELSFLAPHLRRAVTIGDLFETGQRESAMFKEVINQFNDAVFVVATDMKLLFANHGGEALLKSGLAVRAGHHALHFENVMTQDAIVNAVALGERNEVALGATGIGVPIVKGLRPALAHVLPLSRRSVASQFHNHAAAAIFIGQAGSRPMPIIDAMAALFGFTPNEKRVALQLVEGKTRRQIARSGAVLESTIKSQMEAVYGKAGVSGQRALINLIRDLTPNVRSEKR